MNFRSVLHLLYFYIALFCISLIVQSCCTDGPSRIIGAQSFIIYDAGIGGDTIRASFALYAEFALELAESTSSFSPYSSAYGYSCDPGLVNSIDEASISITMDKAFTFDNTPLAPGFNFYDLDSIVSFTVFDSDLSVSFDNDFMDEAEFEVGTHQFYLSCFTDDGVEIRDTVAAYFDVD